MKRGRYRESCFGNLSNSAPPRFPVPFAGDASRLRIDSGARLKRFARRSTGERVYFRSALGVRFSRNGTRCTRVSADIRFTLPRGLRRIFVTFAWRRPVPPRVQTLLLHA